MARTVSSTIDLPARLTHARGELADTRRDSGWRDSYEAVNTLVEHHRGALACDADPAGIATVNTQVHRYRVPLQGLTSEPLTVMVYGGTATAGQVTLRVTASNNASTSTLLLNSTVQAWRSFGLITISDNGSGYDEITINWAGGTVTAHPLLYAVAIVYSRSRTTLLTPSSGAAYADGIVPLDLDAVDGERVLTATRARDPAGNLRAVYARQWPICAASYARSPWTNSQIFFRSERPPQMAARLITARFYIYVAAYTGNGTALQFGQLAVSADMTVAASQVAITSNGWTGPFDLQMLAPAEGTARPFWSEFRVFANQYLTIGSLCGWWTGLSYDDP